MILFGLIILLLGACVGYFFGYWVGYTHEIKDKIAWDMKLETLRERQFERDRRTELKTMNGV